MANENRGFAGKNGYKTKDSQPDWTGKVNVEGKEYYINMWEDESDRMDGKYFSISIRNKD